MCGSVPDVFPPVVMSLHNETEDATKVGWNIVNVQKIDKRNIYVRINRYAIRFRFYQSKICFREIVDLSKE